METLPPERRVQLRAYWMIQHGEDGERGILSGPVTFQQAIHIAYPQKKKTQASPEARRGLLDGWASGNGLDPADLHALLDGG